MKIYYLFPKFPYYFQLCQQVAKFNSCIIQQLLDKNNAKEKLTFFNEKELAFKELISLAQLERNKNAGGQHALITFEVDEKLIPNADETSKYGDAHFDIKKLKIVSIEYRGRILSKDDDFQIKKFNIENIKETYENFEELFAYYDSVPGELSHLWMTDLIFFLKRKEFSLDYADREQGSLNALLIAFQKFVFPKIKDSYKKHYKISVEDILQLHKIIMSPYNEDLQGALKKEQNIIPLVNSNSSKEGIERLLKYIKANPSYKMAIAPYNANSAAQRMLSRFKSYVTSNQKITFSDCENEIEKAIIEWNLGNTARSFLRGEFLLEIQKIFSKRSNVNDSKIPELEIYSFREQLTPDRFLFLCYKGKEEKQEDYQKAFNSVDCFNADNISIDEINLKKQAEYIHAMITKNLFENKIYFFAPNAENISEKLEKIVSDYNIQIEQAKDSKTKSKIIRNFCFSLESMHALNDGNCRLVYVLHHLLRVCNKLKPTMLLDPNCFDGHSDNEMEQMELHGLAFLEELKDPIKLKTYLEEYNMNLSYYTGEVYNEKFDFSDYFLESFQSKIINFKKELLELKNFFRFNVTMETLVNNPSSFWNPMQKNSYDDIMKKYEEAQSGNISWTEAIQVLN